MLLIPAGKPWGTRKVGLWASLMGVNGEKVVTRGGVHHPQFCLYMVSILMEATKITNHCFQSSHPACYPWAQMAGVALPSMSHQMSNRSFPQRHCHLRWSPPHPHCTYSLAHQTILHSVLNIDPQLSHPSQGKNTLDFQTLKLWPVSMTFSSQFSDIVGIPEVPLHAGRSYVLWDSSWQQLWRNTYRNYPLASTCDLILLIRFDWPVSDCWDVSDKPVEVKYGTGNRNQSRSWRWNSPKNLSHQKYLPC
jgi:hypothetical protein